jgi:hypothetical protein
VECRKSYVAQLYDATDKPLGLPVTITTSCGATTPLPCTLLCYDIKYGMIPHGTFAAFTLHTPVPALFTVQASKAPPNANGQLVTVNASASTTALSTDVSNLLLLGLEAQTKYYCVMTATDATNNVVTKPCMFTTLKRTVTVSFDQIYIVDDSDGSTEEEGDLAFHFFVNHSNFGWVKGIWGTGDHISLSGLGLSVVLSAAADSVTLTLFGQDNDDQFGGSVCTSGPLANLASISGSDSCADWSTVERKFDFPKGPGEVWNTSVNIKTYNGLALPAPLKFEVNVTVSVSYQ